MANSAELLAVLELVAPRVHYDHRGPSERVRAYSRMLAKSSD